MGTWSTSKPRTQRNSIKMEDVWQLLDWKDGEYHQIRMLGPISSFEQHWIEFRIADGRKINLPKMCIDYDPKTEALVDGKRRCPYCAAGLKSSRSYIGNCIDRDAQSQRPKSPRPAEGAERKPVDFLGESWRLKDPKSKSWTPVRVIVASNTMAEKLGSLSKINKHTINGKVKTFDVSHPKFGIDVNVRCEKSKGKGKSGGPPNYDAGKEEKTRLTEEEQGYLLHDLRLYKPETVLEAQASWDDLKTKLVTKDEDGEDEDLSYKKPKGGKLGGRAAAADDDDDDSDDSAADDEDDGELGDIEDFDEVLGGKRKSAKTKSKPTAASSGKSSSGKPKSSSSKGAKAGKSGSTKTKKRRSRD